MANDPCLFPHQGTHRTGNPLPGNIPILDPFIQIKFILHIIMGILNKPPGMFNSPRPENQPLQQRITGQPVGTVYPIAGHLPTGVKPGDTGSAVLVNRDTTHNIVRRRGHRNLPFRKIDPILITGAPDVREPLFESFPVQVRKIQVYMVGSGTAHLSDNSPGNHIPGSQLRHLMVIRHETLTIDVAQKSPLTTNRLRDQKARHTAS